MPKRETNESRKSHKPQPGMKNDMTKEEYLAVAKADQADSWEESKDAAYLAQEYGTYEIQRTADTGNVFPAIAQGLSKKWRFDKAKNGVEPTTTDERQ